MERSDRWSQLANAIQMRSTQDQVLWSILGTFWATNALLLVALFTTGDLPKNPIVGIAVAVAGVLVSLVWYLIQNRALGHIARHEQLMKSLEQALELDSELTITNTKSYRQYMRGPPARVVMRALSMVVLVLWAVTLFLFLGRASA